MVLTNKHNDKLVAFLISRHVSHRCSDQVVYVNRTSMVQQGPEHMWEGDIYQWWLQEMKKLLPSRSHISWGIRSDEEIGVEVWE